MRRLTDQVSFASTDLELFTSPALVPCKVFGREAVPVEFFTCVLLWTESANLGKVHIVQEMRALENTKPAIVRTVGREVGDALVQIETVDPPRVLVHVSRQS